MKIYSAKNLEWIFYSLKSQGKIKLTEVDGTKLVLQELRTANYNIGILAKRRRRLQKTCKEINPEKEQERLTRLEYLISSIEERLNRLRATRTDLEHSRDKLINKYIEDTFEKIIRNRIRIIPKIDSKNPEKPVISVDSLDEKLVCQLIKEDLKRVYKVVPADRNEIIEQLKALLESHTEKVIIRADIKSFFESVGLEKVIEKLLRDAYLNKLSLAYLQRIGVYLSEKQIAGLPRGLAFSSYLAEIFLQQTDHRIESIEGVWYYRRYVDDIIIIASPEKSPEKYWEEMRSCVEHDGLRLHEEGGKKVLSVTSEKVSTNFEYLGYAFHISSNGLKVGLSSRRKEKYQVRIDCIFNHYAEFPAVSSKYKCRKKFGEQYNRRESLSPLRKLFAMVSCLTGNGHLEGDKRYVSIGSYYSNRHLTDLSDLEDLDNYLQKCIDTKFNPPAEMFCYSKESDRDEIVEGIREVLRKWTFSEGFRTRRFCKNPKFTLTLGQLKSLVK